MELKYDFDEEIERLGTGALKTDRLKERFGRADLLAAWVADMDFATPPFIIEALKRRLEHPIFGYNVEPDDYKPLIIKWEKDLHDWDIRPDWISYIPGIVKGIGMVVNVFTKPGDDIFIMPPVYHPFRIVTELNGRKVVNIPLKETEDGSYKIDFESLKNYPTEGGVLIFSNPHNPAGKVWNKNELQQLAAICKEKKILVISDEIHADMALWGKKHTPFMTVSKEAADNSITFCAPSKVFNIPGIVTSFSVVPNEEIREKFYGWLKANEFNEAPEFSYVATCAAYREGREWRRQMLEYIEENIKEVETYFSENIPKIKVQRPDASFLVWLDCRELGLKQEELVDMMVNYAKVALNDGAMFGKEGEGFMRLNVGMPRKSLRKVLERIKQGVESYQAK
ncbi:MAG: PatB family C-S lyase [Muribaculaceae bacterium]|nr:PatB family C-S lyase [Muribaculaceae bacterium]